MPIVKVDGIEVTVENGTNMIEAAAVAGVEIPHFCYHQDLSIAGNCRMCLVDVEAGGRGPDIACNMQARDGLEIRTDSDNVHKMRESVMEFLLKNHPLDCPVCDQSGECTLQDHYSDHGNNGSRLADEKNHAPKRQTLSDKIVLDAERCIACSRCVRFGDEITHTGDLRLFERTDHTEIGLFPGEALDHGYQGNLIDICPVGALTSSEFRFQKRVWYLRETPSICTGCATGCNIVVEHQSGEVFRFKPRRNPDVNSSWMCDEGRETWNKSNDATRILMSKIDGKRSDFAAAATAAAELLSGKKVAIVLGTKASNEGNRALSLLGAKLEGSKLFVMEGNDPSDTATSDSLLKVEDKSPNRYGATLVADVSGGAGTTSELKSALTAGDFDALLVLQDDAIGRMGGVTAANVVFIGTYANQTSAAANIVIPAAAHVEFNGSFINNKGVVQRFRRAVHPVGDSLPDYSAVDKVANALCGSVVGVDGAEIFAGLAAAASQLSGTTWATLGTSGQQIGSTQSAGAAAPSK
jgi:NADH-quinone oxidoreductase subunit G